jgi:hypothetical protein
MLWRRQKPLFFAANLIPIPRPPSNYSDQTIVAEPVPKIYGHKLGTYLIVLGTYYYMFIVLGTVVTSYCIVITFYCSMYVFMYGVV